MLCSSIKYYEKIIIYVLDFLKKIKFQMFSQSSILNIFTVYCLPLSSIDNGDLSYTTLLTEEGYIYGTLVEFHCDSGYKPSTSSSVSRRCGGLGEWNGQEQSCIEGNSNIKLKLNEVVTL